MKDQRKRNTRQIVRDEDFIARLKSVVEAYGNVSSLARASGISESAIRKWRDGISEPTRDRLIALADAAQVSVQWLATGEDLSPSIAKVSNNSEKHLSDDAAQTLSISKFKESEHNESRRKTTIFSNSDNLGLIENNPAELFAVSKAKFIEDLFYEYLDITQSDHSNYCLFPVDSRSMEPTLYAGDCCVLNRSKSSFDTVDEGIYIMKLSGVYVVRRIWRIPNNCISLTHDNPSYKAYDAIISLADPPSGISIFGKVAYVFREV